MAYKMPKPRLETRKGISHNAMNIAAGLGVDSNESYPDLFQSFGGFPDGVEVEEGYVVMPELPGIDLEAKGKLYKVIQRFERPSNRRQGNHMKPKTFRIFISINEKEKLALEKISRECNVGISDMTRMILFDTGILSENCTPKR